MSRENEKWIQDRFINEYGIEAFMPGVHASLMEKGYKFTDLKRVVSRLHGLKSMPKAWSKVAKQQEDFGIEAEKRGHLLTASEHYHRAALYYGKAQLYILKISPQKEEIHNKMLQCYKKVIKYSKYKMERVEIPFEDKTIYGVLHLPETKEPAPFVLLLPGSDMIKEDYPFPHDNQFLKRGMAVLSIDGPGQGETRLNGLTVDLDNYQRAGKVVIDYALNRPEIDPEKIGAFGISLGSYNAPLIAAYDKRVKAVVAILGSYTEKTATFNEAQPGFRSNFKFRSGVNDEDEVDRMAKEMTLTKVADKIKATMLLGIGDCDELCSIEEARRFFNMLNCPKELWIFEDEYHPCGGVAAELYPWAIDWLKDQLTKEVDANLNRERFFESRY